MLVIYYSCYIMAQVTKPAKSDYDRVATIGKWKGRVLGFSTLITLLLTLDEKYSLSTIHTSLKDYVPVIIGANVALVALYVWLDSRENFVFSKAERTRTLQYVDNSFDTNFAGKKLEGYFTQEKLTPGFYKFCVNCFENTFHTYNIAKEMQKWVYAKAVGVLLVFIFSALVGDKGVVRYLSEAILPLALLQSAIKLSIFVSRLDTLRETFASFFTSIKSSSFEAREPEALKNVITYETTLAWASIPTDSDIFFRMREQLASEWEELKLQYNIKNSLSK
jgi:hypothetical protein